MREPNVILRKARNLSSGLNHCAIITPHTRSCALHFLNVRITECKVFKLID